MSNGRQRGGGAGEREGDERREKGANACIRLILVTHALALKDALSKDFTLSYLQTFQHHISFFSMEFPTKQLTFKLSCMHLLGLQQLGRKKCRK